MAKVTLPHEWQIKKIDINHAASDAGCVGHALYGIDSSDNEHLWNHINWGGYGGIRGCGDNRLLFDGEDIGAVFMESIMGLGLMIAMGVSLGLFGAGGSILAVPILVYFFNIPAVLATGYSLVLVGLTAGIGAIRYRKQVQFKVGILLAIPSALGVWVSRRYILQAMPEVMQIQSITVGKNDVVLAAFALIMGGVAIAMLINQTGEKPRMAVNNHGSFWLVFEGIMMGIVTGFVGVGGGFIIVPVLMGLVGLSFQQAVATSLLIIFIKSIMGMLADISMAVQFNGLLLVKWMGLTVIGIAVGEYLSRWVKVNRLKQLFAVGVLVMSMIIIWIR